MASSEQVSYLREAELRHLQEDGRNWLPNMQHLPPLIAELQPGSLLDFGCSSGYFLETLEVSPKYGFDTDPYALEKARQRGLEVFDQWEDVPPVEMVCAIDVLEHLTPQQVVEHLWRWRDKLTGPGAHVLVQTDNPRCWAAHLEFYNDWTHVRMYDFETVRNLFTLAGFEPVWAKKTYLMHTEEEMNRMQQVLPDRFHDPYGKWLAVFRWDHTPTGE